MRRLFPTRLPFDAWRVSSAVPRLVAWFREAATTGRRAASSARLGSCGMDRRAGIEPLEPRWVLTSDVMAGIDLFVTPTGGTSFDFADTPIPSDFFNPGSDPFFGEVKFTGEPLGQSAGDDVGQTDTIVRRLDDADFDPVGSGANPGEEATVPIQIVALSLRSVEPIIVTFDDGTSQLWDVEVTLSQDVPQPQGEMTIRHEGSEGGTFDSTLPVLPRFGFTLAAGGSAKEIDPGPLKLFTSQGSWVHQADPEFQVIEVGAGVQVDGDGDGSPDAPLPASSNFAPGIAGLPLDPVEPPLFQVRDLVVHETPDARHTVAIAQQPDLTLDKVDVLHVDADGDGRPDPGDTIRYQFEIQNSPLAGDASGLVLSDLLPPGTSFVPGSLAIGPHASRDIYSSLGGVTLSVDATHGLLANDFDIDGVTPQSSLVVQPETKGTLLGGIVQIQADGTFTYTPPTGVRHQTDAFRYTSVDDDQLSSTGWAQIALGGNAWFVDSSNLSPTGGDGSLANPFTSFAPLNGPADVDEPGDVIYVFGGNSATTPYDVGLVLEDDQRLVGEGVGLSVGDIPILPPGPRPILTNSSGDVLTLASRVTIEGLDIVDSDGTAIVGNGVSGPIQISNVDVQDSDASGGGGLHLTGATGSIDAGNNLNWSFGNTTSVIPNVVVADSDNLRLTVGGTLTTGSGRAVSITNTSNSFIKIGTIRAAGDASGGKAIAVGEGTDTIVDFSSVEIDVTGGTGIWAEKIGKLSIADPGSSVHATGGAALHIQEVTLSKEIDKSTPILMSSLSSTNSSAEGVSLISTFGGLTVSGDLTVDGAAKQGLLVKDSSLDLRVNGDIIIRKIDATGAAAVHLDNAGGTITLGDDASTISISEVKGTGLRVSDSPNTDLHIKAGKLTISNIGSSGQDGVSIVNSGGTITISSNTLIKDYGSGGAGAGLHIDKSTPMLMKFTSTLRVDNIGSSGQDGVSIAQSPGLDIKFDRLEAGVSDGAALRADGGGTLTVQGGSLYSLGGPVLEGKSMKIDIRLHDLVSDQSSSSGLVLDNLDGSLTVTGQTFVNDPTTHGIVSQNHTSVFKQDFGPTKITGSGDSTSGVVGDGVRLVSSPLTTTSFRSLEITTEHGTGLLGDEAGTLKFRSPQNSIDATGGAALDLTNTESTTRGGGMLAVPRLVNIQPTGEMPGGPLGGSIVTFEATLQLDLTGFGEVTATGRLAELSGVTRTLTIPVTVEAAYGPRTPGDPVQNFESEMISLEGELFGDPDFDLLRVTSGTDFGLPSPGQTTLTRLPSGDFQVDSFFDIAYRIEYTGAPGSVLEGVASDSTVPMQPVEQTTLPVLPVFPGPIVIPDAGGTVVLPTGPVIPPDLPLPLLPPAPSPGLGLLLPPSPSLSGLDLVLQGVVVDPSAGFTKLSSTNSPTVGVRVSGTNSGVSADEIDISGAGQTGVEIDNSNGSVTFRGGTISTGAGTSWKVSGGTSSVKFEGDLDHQGDGPAVDVRNHSGGTITIQGGDLSVTKGTGLQFDAADGFYKFGKVGEPFILDSSASGADAGVDIQNSDGTFTLESLKLKDPANEGVLVQGGNSKLTFIKLDIDTTGTNQSGLVADGGGAGRFKIEIDGAAISTGGGAGISITGAPDGSLTVTGSGNKIETTTGVALKLHNTKIGPDGLTFESIDTDGALTGIDLNNTGTEGGLTVTGNSTIGSGGTIKTTDTAVVLKETNSVTLKDMSLSSAMGREPTPIILTAKVDALTLDRVHVTTGASATHALAGENVQNLSIINNSVLDGSLSTAETIRLQNLHGNSQIDSSIIQGGSVGLAVLNTAGDAVLQDTLKIDGTEIMGGTDANIRVVADQTANLQLLLGQSGLNTFLNAGNNSAEFAASGTATLQVSLTNTQITGNAGSAVQVAAIEDSTVKAHLFGLQNLSSATGATVVNAQNDGTAGATGSPTLHLTIEDVNGISLDNGGNGIVAAQNGNGTLNVKVDEVTITGNGANAQGILVFGNGGVLNATITNNVVDLTSAASAHGIAVEADATGTVRLELANNDSQADGVSAFGHSLRRFHPGTTFELQDFSGTGILAADVEHWVTTQKSNTGTVRVLGHDDGVGYTPTTEMVPMPMLPEEPPAFGVATSASDTAPSTVETTPDTITIDPTQPGITGTGVNLGKDEQSPGGVPIVNGVVRTDTPSSGQSEARGVAGDGPPMVTLVAPTGGTSVIEGTTLPVQVTASDDVGVARVELFVDGALHATDLTAPYDFTIPLSSGPDALGLLQIDAVAVDTSGQVNSDTVTVLVVDDQPPTVAITSPTPGEAFVEGSAVTVQADTTDDVRVQRVEFYVDGNLVDIDSTAPYERALQMQIPTTSTRNLVFEVVVVDSSGQTGSDSVQVTATPAGSLPPTIDLGDLDFGTTIQLRFDAIIDGAPPVLLGVPGDPLLENQAILAHDGGTLLSDDPRPDLVVGGGVGNDPPEVRLFDNQSRTQFDSVMPDFGPGYTGGLTVATADVNGDGTDDIIMGAATGLAHVRVVDGTNHSRELVNFFPYGPSFTGGVNVAAGDLNGDGRADIITGAASGLGAGDDGPHVKAFSLPQIGDEVLVAFDPGFDTTGGVRVAVGDVDGDGILDIVTGAGPGAGPHVRVIDGSNPGTLLADFFAYNAAFTGGIYVAAGDLDGDGRADIVTGAGGDAASPTTPAGPRVRAFDGASPTAPSGLLADFFAYNLGFGGGVRVATGDLNHDGRPDIVVGRGPDPAPDIYARPPVAVFDTGSSDTGSVPRLIDSFLAFDPGFTGGVFVAGGNLQPSNPTLTSVPTADLRVSVNDVPDPVVAGTELTYTIDVTNDGPSVAENVVLSVPVPAHTTFVSASTTSTGGTYQTSTGTWSIGSLPIGTESLTLTVRVDQGTLQETQVLVLVTSTTFDPDPDNNLATESTEVRRETDLEIVSLTDIPDPVIDGRHVTYELEVRNNGPSLAEDVTVEITTPLGFIFDPNQSSPTVLVEPGRVLLGPIILGTTQSSINLASFVAHSSTGPAEVAVFGLVPIEVCTSPKTTPAGGSGEAASTTCDPNPDNNSATTTTTVIPYDFGDAPDAPGGPATGNPYPTLLEHNGPRHIVGDLRFGTLLDNEPDGQPNAAATGDDNVNLDDEDGLVSISRLTPGSAASLTLAVQGTGGTARHVNAWIDFEGDGDFTGPGEQIATNLIVSSDGNHVVNFTVPAVAALGDTVARFRLSTAAGLTPQGAADDGEVEDHGVTIGSRLDNLVVTVTPGTITENQAVSLNASFDSGDIPHTFSVSWGDGSSVSQMLPAGQKSFSLTHTYRDDRPSGTPVDDYDVVVTVQNGEGDFVADLSSTVRVHNVPPTITSLALTPDTLNEGSSVHLSGSFGDPGVLDQFTLQVDWDGNGTFDTTVPVAGGLFNVGHVYSDDPFTGDTFQVSVRLSDDDGGVTSRQAEVTVENVPPVVDAGPDAVSAVGSPLSRTIVFTDPGADSPWQVTVDWGDGSPPQSFFTSAKSVPLSHTYLSPGLSTVTVTIDDQDGGIGSDTFEVLRPGFTAVEGVHLFYNNSALDNNGAAVTLADNAARATDKVPLTLAHQGRLENISGYSRGINGIFIDVRGLPGGGAQLTKDDFMVQVGRDNFPDTWPMGPMPTAVGVLTGAGEGGSDRVYLTFPDDSIENTWLRLTIKATPATGLAAAEDYFFGSSPGETGEGLGISGFAVDSFDIAWVAVNITPLSEFGTEPVTQRADINRDRSVDSRDWGEMLVNIFATLPLITPQQGSPGVAAAVAADWGREIGDRGQETGNRGQETGDRWEETGDWRRGMEEAREGTEDTGRQSRRDWSTGEGSSRGGWKGRSSRDLAFEGLQERPLSDDLLDALVGRGRDGR